MAKAKGRQVLIRAALVLALAALTAPARSADVIMYDSAPSAEALAKVLLGGTDTAPAGGQRWRDVSAIPLSFRNTESSGMRQPAAVGFNIRFELDSARIAPRDFAILDQVAQTLRLDAMRDKALVVQGHTDASGADNYNLALSQRRAESVVAYLTVVRGIEPSRLIAVGKGETELLDRDAPNAAVNRRVQFYVPAAN